MNIRHLLILSFLLLSFQNAFAANDFIVLLKTTPTPAAFAPRANDLPKNRYVKAMNYQKFIKTNVLEKFTSEFKSRLSLRGSKVKYLPLITAVVLELNSTDHALLLNDSRVAKIIPNSPIFLDKPLKLISRGLPMMRGAELNSSLVLHRVDQLIKDGVDINKVGKIVGVVDTGVDGKHPALKGKVVAFKDMNNGSTDPVDSDEHGTHVCGIIAGAEINNLQIGVYPGAKLVVASGLNDGTAGMLNAWQWIMNPDGDVNTPDQPFVVNNSWHIGSADPEPFYRAIEAFKAADILLAFSAGNAGTSGITKPKEHPLTFTSAAVDSDGTIADFSSVGPGIYHGTKTQKPEVATMGVQVYSSVPGGKYAKMSGTSMASPFTAGAVALLGTYFPDKSPYLIAEVLKQTTQTAQVGALDWDAHMGFGLMDVHAAYMKLKNTRARMFDNNNANNMPRNVSNGGFQNSRIGQRP